MFLLACACQACRCWQMTERHFVSTVILWPAAAIVIALVLLTIIDLFSRRTKP